MTIAGTANDTLENGVKQPLLISSHSSHEMDGNDDGDQDEEFDGSDEAPEKSRKPATSLASAYRLLTPSVKASNLIGFQFSSS